MNICEFRRLLRQTLLNQMSLEDFAETLTRKWLKEPFEDPLNDDPVLPMNEALFEIIETVFGFAEGYHLQFPVDSPFDVDEASLREAVLDGYDCLARFLAVHPEYACVGDEDGDGGTRV